MPYRIFSFKIYFFGSLIDTVMIRAVGLFDTTCVSLKIFITPIRPPPAVEVSAVLNAIISPTTNGLILFDVILDAEIAFYIDSAVALSKSNPGTANKRVLF